MEKATWTGICDAARRSGATTDIGGDLVKLKASQMGSLYYDAGRVMRRQFISGTYAGGGTDDKMTKVRDYAFYGLTQLQSFNSKSCKEIGAHAFDGCTKLSTLNFTAVTAIGDSAFKGCTALSDISAMTGTVTKIGPSAFAGCTGLTGAIEFASATKFEDYGMGLEFCSPFEGCTGLTSISLPVLTGTVPPMPDNIVSLSAPNATAVSNRVLSNCCKTIKSVTLTACKNIGSYTFQDCTLLTSIDLPALINLEYYTFYGCTRLTSLTFPAVISIDGRCTFSGCTSLTTIDFPAVTSIGDDTYGLFQDCTSLTAIILRSPSVVTLSNTVNRITTLYDSGGTVPALSASSSSGYIYVPAALVDSYKTATNWSTISDKFRALESYTVDGTTTGALDSSKI